MSVFSAFSKLRDTRMLYHICINVFMYLSKLYKSRTYKNVVCLYLTGVWLIIVRSVRLGYWVYAQVNSGGLKSLEPLQSKCTVAFYQINNIINCIIYFQICRPLVWGNQYMYKLLNTCVFIWRTFHNIIHVLIFIIKCVLVSASGVSHVRVCGYLINMLCSFEFTN